MSDADRQARVNLDVRIRQTTYPGRGLVVGTDAAGAALVQVYWIMGRSPNSRNRVFVAEGGHLRTEPADPAQCDDPSLIIYNAMRELDGVYIATNGDQTDTIHDTLRRGNTFEQALAKRAYEPDGPNFTPRISGLWDLRGAAPLARLAVLRHSAAHDTAVDRCYYHYEALTPGLGYCITTYMDDGKPLPPFVGDPYLVPLLGDIEAIANTFWDALDNDNRVSLAVKGIDLATRESRIVVVNQYEQQAP